MSIVVKHHAGFFSCSCHMLYKILDYFNEYGELPATIDTTYLFTWYKPTHMYNVDILDNYFIKYENPKPIVYEKMVKISRFPRDIQFSDYKNILFRDIKPFITTYFTLADDIKERIHLLETKYKLNNYSNICVLFYRGNDKQHETIAPSYNTFITKANQIKSENPNIRFLIQSDETEFIKAMDRALPNTVIFNDEIRHIPKCNETVDNVYRDSNAEYSKYFLAIVYIMSKCKHIVCTSGNCSLWIVLFRGNAENLHQYLQDKPVIYDVPNEDYDPFKKNFWL